MKQISTTSYFGLSITCIIFFILQLAYVSIQVKKQVLGDAQTLSMSLFYGLAIFWAALGTLFYYKAKKPAPSKVSQILIFVLATLGALIPVAIIYVVFVLLPLYGQMGDKI